MRIVKDRDIYVDVVEKGMLRAQKLLWIASANLKDMHVKQRRRYRSILDSFATLARDGVQIRLIHASRPSVNFLKSMARHPELSTAMEMLICPRTHFKTVIVDGKWAYTAAPTSPAPGWE